MTHPETDREQSPRHGAARKKNVRRYAFAAAVAVLLILAFLAGRTSRLLMLAGHDHDNDVHTDHDTAAEGEQWYTCSMHPQVRTTDPREKCPICGMDLIPVRRDRDEGDPALPRLSLDPRSAALLQVETMPVARRDISSTLHLYGMVEVDETRIRHIAAWVPGRLDKLHVNATGVDVRVGDPMVLIYSPALVAAQKELLLSLDAVERLHEQAAPSHRAGAEALADAARDKLRLLGLSRQQVEEIAQRGTVEDHLLLTSPVNGVVTAREATEGMYVTTGDRIYSIVDLDHLWAHLEVHEREADWLRTGQRVTFSVRALPGESFRGTVSFIQPTVNEATRTVQVRVELPNPGRRLKPGMFVTGEVSVPFPEKGPLVVPASAPLITGRRAVVYVQDPDSPDPVFHGREVVLGPRAGDFYVIHSGLSEGERVVTRGNFKIDSELQIRGRPSMMAPEGGGAPVHQHGDTGSIPPEAGAAPEHLHEDTTAAPSPAPPRTPPVKPAVTTAVPAVFGQQMASVLRANFSLVEGLFESDVDKTRVAAARARDRLIEVDASALDAVAGDFWRSVSGRMRSALTTLMEHDDPDDMRPYFETFSDALTDAVRRFGTGPVAPVYRAVCPMVQGREGFWLQPQRAITNPYHGERMPTCGSIVETLAPESKNTEKRQ
jgi:membrane fusion protein, copper/silver efflux system